jgi:DNA-binding NtrC family response regulator
MSSDPRNRDGIQGRWQELADQKSDLDDLEKAIIEDALAACEGIVARTARMLSVPRTGLISRMATLDIDPERFKSRVASH